MFFDIFKMRRLLPSPPTRKVGKGEVILVRCTKASKCRLGFVKSKAPADGHFSREHPIRRALLPFAPAKKKGILESMPFFLAGAK